MRNPGGYITVHSGEGKLTRESDSFTCAHGNEIVRVAPGTVDQAPRCLRCMGRICLKCQGIANRTLKCDPIEEKLLRMERRGKSVREPTTFLCAHGHSPEPLMIAAAVHCQQCRQKICPDCAESGECLVFEKKLLEREGYARFRRALTG